MVAKDMFTLATVRPRKNLRNKIRRIHEIDKIDISKKISVN